MAGCPGFMGHKDGEGSGGSEGLWGGSTRLQKHRKSWELSKERPRKSGQMGWPWHQNTLFNLAVEYHRTSNKVP